VRADACWLHWPQAGTAQAQAGHVGVRAVRASHPLAAGPSHARAEAGQPVPGWDPRRAGAGAGT
jgi:hypothetical protein